MEDGDFWGHSFKTEGRRATEDGIAIVDSIDRKASDLNAANLHETVSNDNLVRIDQLETVREERVIGPMSATARKLSIHTAVESEQRHTRSPSYDEDDGHDPKSGSPTPRSKSGSDYENYSDHFDTSDSDDFENEQEQNNVIRSIITDRLKPYVDEAEEKRKDKPLKNRKSPEGGSVQKRSMISKPKRRPKVQPSKIAVSSSRAPTKNAPTISSRVVQSIATNRYLRSAELRNELDYLKKQLSEAKHENRTLREMQRRHEVAIARLDSNRAAMPSLLERQTEEIRVAKEQLRMQKEKSRDMDRLLRERDDRLMHALDKIRRLEKSAKEKDADHGIQSTGVEALNILRAQLEEKEEKNQALEKRMALLIKNHKHQLSIEVMRHKETQRKLRQLEAESQRSQTNKTRGYHTTRTARKSQSDPKIEDVAKTSTKVDPNMSNSLHSSKRDSVEDDITAQTKNVLNSLKSNAPSEERDQTKLSKARSVRTMKKGQSISKKEDAVGVGRQRSKEKIDQNEEFFIDKRDDEFGMREVWGSAERRKRLAQTDKANQQPTSMEEAPSNGPRRGSEARKLTSLLLDDSTERKEPKSTVVDEIFQSTEANVKESNQAPQQSASNSDFLDNLFGPKPNAIGAQTQIDSTDKSGVDSGVDNSVDSTPKQVQSAKKTKSGLDFDDAFFSKKKIDSNQAIDLFPWEVDAVQKRTNVHNLGSVT